MSDDAIELTVFVPCYNEADNIVGTFDTIIAAAREVKCSFEIIVIDDASTDGSVEIIRAYQASHNDIPIVLHVNESNEGLGNNYAEGAFIGRGTWYRLVCGDNVEPKETLVTVFSSIGEADVVLFYQPLVPGRTLGRRMLSKLYTWIVSAVSGYRLQYYNGMPLTKRYNVMRWHSNSHGFGFQADLVTRLLDRGMSYIEVPVMAHERLKGTSKALTFRNLCSVAHSLVIIAIRRMSKILYGRS